MGNCRSTQSTAVETGTGITYTVPDTKQPKKKKNFTQYPAHKRPVNDPYVPHESAFKQVDETTRVATERFVNYGGGNALVLVDDHSPVQQEQKLDAQKQYVSGAVSNAGSKFLFCLQHLRSAYVRLFFIGFSLLYFLVTVPPGLRPGDLINIRTPDGQYVAVTVPEGMSEGSSFLVEFAPGAPPPSTTTTTDLLPEKEPDIPVAVPVSY